MAELSPAALAHQQRNPNGDERHRAYDTQAFSPLPDRCFRLVSGGEGGGPTHCPEPSVWRGPFRAPNGRRYQVEACEGHRAQVTTAPG